LSDLDERIRRAMERATAPADPAGAYERVTRKRIRRRAVRRAQAIALTVAVVIVTSGVTFTLGRMFGSDRQEEASRTQDPTPFFVPDIAFAGEVDGKPGIYAMRADGTDVRALTKAPGRRIAPSWSPDGTKLAFESDHDGNMEIYVLDVATGEERQVTDDPADDASPAWSPDGTKLAFVSQRDGGTHLYLIDADGDEAEGTEVTRLTFEEQVSNYDPAWSVDGTHIYFARDPVDGVEHPDVYVLKIPSASQPDPPPPTPWSEPGSIAYQPAPSPDGERIAFVSTRADVSQVFVASADGSGVLQVTTDPAPKSNPSWSPDGRRIVFSAGEEKNDLYVMNANGTGVQQITETPGDSVTPAWNPSAPALPEPDEGSADEPRCLSEDDAALEPSLRKPGSLRGDVDGDGNDDEVSVAIDPQADTPCRYFLVVATSGALTAARIEPTELGPTDEALALEALVPLDTEPGLEIVVDVWHEAATEFAAVFTMRDDIPVRMQIEAPQFPEDVFAYGGSLSGLSGVDCAEEPGDLLLGIAAPEGDAWTVDRWPLVVEGDTVRLDPSAPEPHEQHTISEEDVSSGALAERFSEFGAAPFLSCPGAVRASET
jgi:Tol biopolymer transport system component